MNILKKLYDSRYIHYFIIGSIGTGINLVVNWICTSLVFGPEHYMIGIVLGLAISIIYNFVLQTIVTFKTKTEHFKRLFVFAVYSLILSYIEAVVMSTLIVKLGVQYYLFIIAGVILAFSIVTFLFFKLWLFKEDENVADKTI